MLAVENMSVTLDFYATFLSFTPIIQTDSYSVVERDSMRIHFMLASDQSALEAVRGHAEIYIEVEGIEEIWRSISTENIPYKIKPLFEQPYGMKEFHIEDPNGVLVFVAEAIA